MRDGDDPALVLFIFAFPDWPDANDYPTWTFA